MGLFIEASQPPLNVVHSQSNVRFTLHYKRSPMIFVLLIILTTSNFDSELRHWGGDPQLMFYCCFNAGREFSS
jgi:hypothetical protein